MDELIANLIKIKDQLATSTDHVDSLYPQCETCQDVLTCIITEIRKSRKYQRDDQQVAVQQKLEKIIQSLSKALRANKRQYVRAAASSVTNDDRMISLFDALMKLSENVISEISIDPDDDGNNGDDDHHGNNNSGLTNNVKSSTATMGYPTSVHEYKRRLEKHSKELYKNPPSMPPDPVIVIQLNTNIMKSNDQLPPPPTRDLETQRITFYTPYEYLSTRDQKKSKAKIPIIDFHPNVTPEEVLLGGAFGGTYFRNIHSAVTNVHYVGTDVIQETLAPEWLQKFDSKAISTKLTSSTYRTSVNKFKSKCGGSLGMWESSGWISDIDPYGWFQWYCQFYRGRRSSDDARQIARWKALAGPKGRFKSQLCNKILQRVNGTTMNSDAMMTAIDDASISPVVRQTLFHWGLLITRDVMEQHQKR